MATPPGNNTPKKNNKPTKNNNKPMMVVTAIGLIKPLQLVSS